MDRSITERVAQALASLKPKSNWMDWLDENAERAGVTYDIMRSAYYGRACSAETLDKLVRHFGSEFTVLLWGPLETQAERKAQNFIARMQAAMDEYGRG